MINIIGGFVLVVGTLLTILIIQRRRFIKQIKALEEISKAKDQLFLIIGHDLNNTICDIPPAIKIFREGEITLEERASLLDNIEEDALASSESLKNLIAWGKLKLEGILSSPVKFDASKIICNNLTKINQPINDKDLTVKNSISRDIEIYADISQFKFIIKNLLSNAVKFCGHSGIIEIEAYPSSQSEFMIFSIKDCGVGVGARNVKMVFDPLNTNESGTENEEGSGIALMLCKEYATANGGKMWVAKEKSGGVIFYVAMRTFDHSKNF